jgi:hypothetical protein
VTYTEIDGRLPDGIQEWLDIQGMKKPKERRRIVCRGGRNEENYVSKKKRRAACSGSGMTSRNRPSAGP